MSERNEIERRQGEGGEGVGSCERDETERWEKERELERDEQRC